MKLIVKNRKAFYDYEFVESFEAGIELLGTEVKSLREGRANLRDSFAVVRGGEVWLRGMHVSPYSHTSNRDIDPDRPRRLLLHRREIRRLIGKVEEKGLTLIATRLYFNDRGKAKVELALGRGKRNVDKRRTIAERDAKRDLERALKYRK